MDKDISFSRFLVEKKNRAGITNQGTSGNATGLDVLIMLSNNDNK
jgi:tartrate dehydratase alpha subunit/fumarate hydratase class I-like protein